MTNNPTHNFRNMVMDVFTEQEKLYNLYLTNYAVDYAESQDEEARNKYISTKEKIKLLQDVEKLIAKSYNGRKWEVTEEDG